jgi:hypothetical protein
MESIEERIRVCLHDLLKGESSPGNLVITYGVTQYIKDHSKDIGEIVNIEVKLQDTFEEEASRCHSRLFKPLFGFYDLNGTYEIKSVQRQKCSYENSQERKSTFISPNDLLKEKAIDDNLTLIDRRGDLLLIIPEGKEMVLKSTLINIKEDLELNIQRDLKIGKNDVYSSSDVIYDKTYKLELVIFSKKMWALPHEEVKLEYYKWYIQEEFEKLKYDLEKYYEYQDQKKHLSIIDFYIDKFSEEIDKQSDGNIKECFALFNSELQNLRHEVDSYYGCSFKKATDPEKLVWTVSFNEFINFVEPLINCGNISFKGEKDKYSIYTNLINNILIKQKPDLTIDAIMEFLKIIVLTPGKEVEKCKLTWNGTRNEFAEKFKKNINRTIPEKSKLLYQGKSSLRAIAINLHELFQIENKNRPGKYISKESLIQAFKG